MKAEDVARLARLGNAGRERALTRVIRALRLEIGWLRFRLADAERRLRALDDQTPPARPYPRLEVPPELAGDEFEPEEEEPQEG